jgi:hypothetical protein
MQAAEAEAKWSSYGKGNRISELLRVEIRFSEHTNVKQKFYDLTTFWGPSIATVFFRMFFYYYYIKFYDLFKMWHPYLLLSSLL